MPPLLLLWLAALRPVSGVALLRAESVAAVLEERWGPVWLATGPRGTGGDRRRACTMEALLGRRWGGAREDVGGTLASAAPAAASGTTAAAGAADLSPLLLPLPSCACTTSDDDLAERAESLPQLTSPVAAAATATPLLPEPPPCSSS